MTGPGRHRATSTRRAAIEAGLLLAVLLLPYAVVFAATEGARWPVLMTAAAEGGILAGVVASLRRATPARSRWRTTLAASGAVIIGVWVGATLGIGAGLLLTPTPGGLSPFAAPPPLGEPASDPWLIPVFALTVGTAAAAGALMTLATAGGLAALWSRWTRLRRRQLRWALTHSLLVGSAAMAALIGVALTTAMIITTPIPSIAGIIRPDASAIEEALAMVTIVYVPSALALFLVPLVLAGLIVPPAALIAFPVLGRATGRVEELATAAAAIRGGDLSARTVVGGEDEIAGLQGDFNAMAADLERSLTELRAERDAVGRLLSARRDLVAAVSHELRTPLATLRGYLDSVRDNDEEGLDSALRRDLDVMAAEAERLDRLIDDLFTLSRAELGGLPLAVAAVAVEPLVAAIVATTAPLAWARSRVELTTRVEGDLPPVLADPDRLAQVVRNLVTNAVRHTPPGGLVLISAEPAGEQVALSVRDTGEGIAAADLPLIWDRFYRAGAAPDRTGAGLGLSLVKELTEAMGGSVAAESTPGAGSCFSVRLPRATVPSPPNAAPSPTSTR